MQEQEKGDDLHPGWEQHSKHSVGKRDRGSPWGSRPSHSAQRRAGGRSPPCSECRQSALDATLALEHGSPGDEIKHGSHGSWGLEVLPVTQSGTALFPQYSMQTAPPGVTQHGGLDPGPFYGVCCPCFMDSKRVPSFLTNHADKSLWVFVRCSGGWGNQT